MYHSSLDARGEKWIFLKTTWLYYKFGRKFLCPTVQSYVYLLRNKLNRMYSIPRWMCIGLPLKSETPTVTKANANRMTEVSDGIFSKQRLWVGICMSLQRWSYLISAWLKGCFGQSGVWIMERLDASMSSRTCFHPLNTCCTLNIIPT